MSIQTVPYPAIEERSSGSFAPEVSRRIPELDGLRGLAILLVVICHYIGTSKHAPLGYYLDRFLSALSIGWSGVDLFFVLSGFLIGGILLDARNSPRYFQGFYLRRVYRILPIYFAWIALYAGIVGFALILLPGKTSLTRSDIAQVPYYFLFLQNMMYAPTLFQWKWLSVTWSLAVEEQFYLVAPPLIRLFSLRRLIIVLASVILACPILRFFVFRYFPGGNYAAVFAMPCRADALAFGVLAAATWRQPRFRSYLEENPTVLKRALTVSFLGLAALLWWLVHPVSVVTVTIGYTWLAIMYTCLLLMVLSQTSGIIAGVMRWDALRRLGEVSYCVYLIHTTVNFHTHWILLHAPPEIYDLKGIGVTFLSGLLVWGVASLSWRYFEKPLIRRGHRYAY